MKNKKLEYIYKFIMNSFFNQMSQTKMMALKLKILELKKSNKM